MSQDIYVFIEQRDGVVQNVGYELIGEARTLAADLRQQVIAVLLGRNVRKYADELVAYGADKVLIVEHDYLQEYMTEPYAKALTEIIRTNEPEIMLFGATSIGRDLAPRVAARVRTGLTADCTGLNIDTDTKLLRMTRPAFGGNLMAIIQCKNHRPQMATVRPGVMQPAERDDDRTGIVEVFPVTFTEADRNVEILEVIRQERKQKCITQARILVSGGRGVGKAGFPMLYDLADALGGEVCGSRVSIDCGCLDKEKQVGQTGKTVRPELYLACGISGAIQHVAGMENSNLVIAINKNETAPIFGVSDLGIVGDLNAIVPKLTDAVRAAKAAGFSYIAPASDQFMGLENVLFHIQNGIAYLTINRTKSLNALNSKTLQEISAVADSLKENREVKALIIRGAGGRAFVAGADIAEMQDLDEEGGRAISRLAQDAFMKIKQLPQIVIAAINGYTLGGGNELAMACDIRIASSRARFGQPEVNLGLLPGFTGTQRLSRLVGPGNAKYMIFSAEQIGAEEALRMGLVSKVVAPEALDRTVRDLALKIMSKSLFAVAQAKQAINEGIAVDLENGLAIENDRWSQCFSEQGEAREGMSAFVEKRPAVFKNE